MGTNYKATENSSNIALDVSMASIPTAFHKSACLWEVTGKWKAVGLSFDCQCRGCVIV